MVIFYQPDDRLVIFHVVGKGDADTTYWVLHDPVDEEGGIGHEFTNPVRVGALGNGPLQYVRLPDSFQECVERLLVRHQ